MRVKEARAAVTIRTLSTSPPTTPPSSLHQVPSPLPPRHSPECGAGEGQLRHSTCSSPPHTFLTPCHSSHTPHPPRAQNVEQVKTSYDQHVLTPPSHPPHPIPNLFLTPPTPPPPQAQNVEQVKTSYAQHVLTEQHAAVLSQLAEEGDVYGRLSRSIAPEIFGMEDVKKVWGKCGRGQQV